MWRRRPTLWGALISIAAFCVGFAAGMIYSAERSEISYKQYSLNSAKADADRAHEYEERYCRPLLPPARDKCVNEQEYAAHQAEHDDRDLEAQRTTAVWTHYLGIAGIFGIAFGLLGVVFVLLTFRENKRSADAAHEANRPWVEGEMPTDVALTFTSEGVEMAADVAVINHGKSPATNVMVRGKLIAVPVRESGISAMASRPEKKMTVSRSGIEAALDDWEREHRLRGKIAYPGKPTSAVMSAELGISEIREAEGDPPESCVYFLVVGVSYRFGEKRGRTVAAYIVIVMNHDDLIRAPYSVPDNTTVRVSRAAHIELVDTLEGYAI